MTRTVDRREFLRTGALLGGGLIVGTYLRFGPESAFAETLAAAGDFSPNVFVTIAPSGVISIVAPNSEMGQGIKTGLPMIVAEELDVPFEQVTIVQGDLNPAYGRQASVGSGSTVGNWASLRKAGATARAMLVTAAAQSWSVPEAELSTDKGFVVHATSKRRASYGELATKAAAVPVPANPPLKDPKDFTLIGTRVRGVDNAKIVVGAPLFGIDVRLPGMLYATYTKSPAPGGEVLSANLDEIKSMLGVRDAFVFNSDAYPGHEAFGLPSGVAIVADSTWNAFSATKALKVQWKDSAAAKLNSTEMAKQAVDLAKATPPDQI